jgi:predicted anti-sigma-YlaC factor YlaD
MNCADCEINLSDYCEGTLDAGRAADMDRHFSSCATCRELAATVREVMQWRADFPVHVPPPWLAGRIVASTPMLVRESWRDTANSAWNWLSSPRIAMTVFASVLVLGWTASLVGLPTQPSTLVRNPSEAYYSAESLVYEMYDEAVRSWYRSRIATEVYCRIEQLREIT